MIKEVALSECCKIINGSTPSRVVPDFWGGEIHWFTPKDLSGLEGKYVDEAPEKISEAGYNSCSTTMVPAFSLLLTSRAPIGHIAINKRAVCTNQGFKSLVPNISVDINYLYYCFKKMVPVLQDMGNGATFKELSKLTLEKIQIPLPPLETQKKIAAIMDAADAYRQKTKALIEKYDELAQSLFLEMFGDPVKNEKGWRKEKMEKICKKVTDGTHDTPQRLTEGVKFITGKHIRPFLIDYENSDYVTDQVHNEIFKRCNPELGDVLYTNIGVNLGTAALNVVDYEFSMKNVALLKPKEEFIKGRFLEFFLNNQNVKSKLLSSVSAGGAQQFLSLKVIRDIEVIIPPFNNQNIFAEKVIEIEKQRSLSIKALEKSEELFNSLLQKAFNGTLII